MSENQNSEISGIINLYKPSGFTSHDAVAKIKRIYGTKKVGHAGTLDPMATGVLPVLVGKATSAQEYLTDHDKSYLASVRFGVTTDSGDITGNILSQSEKIPSEQELLAIFPRFVGKQKQTPPMYSAIKIGGKKLYELAREGKTVERPERDIEIYKIEPKGFSDRNTFSFEVFCSKGTYIRTLCEDIGKALSCDAAMAALERTSCGAFSVNDSVSLTELEKLFENGETEKLRAFLASPEKVFSHLSGIKLPKFYAGLCKNGCEIYFRKLNVHENDYADGQLLRLYDENDFFFAVGKCGTFKDGFAVKAASRF